MSQAKREEIFRNSLELLDVPQDFASYRECGRSYKHMGLARIFWDRSGWGADRAVVTMSKRFFPVVPVESTVETVKHEAAHVAQAFHIGRSMLVFPHGAEWLAFMRTLGVTKPEVASEMDLQTFSVLPKRAQESIAKRHNMSINDVRMKLFWASLAKELEL